MTTVIEDNETNWLILTEDGGTEVKTKSSELNQLLYGHDLFGLLDTGNTIWQSSGRDGEPSVTIIPDENAECYTIQVADYPDLTLGAQRKTDLIDAMAELYGEYNEESVAPILDLYEEVRGNMVRPEVLSPFLDVFGDKVAERDDGWFINGHLLLTFEGEFYHPDNVSRNRSGSVIGEGTSVEAYDVNIDAPSGEMNREVTVEGQEYRLTNGEMRFIARVIWGIKNTPDRR